MDRPDRVRNCAWGYRCSKRWEDLTVTTDDMIRQCADCNSAVYRCNDRVSLADAVLQGHCVSFPAELLEGVVDDLPDEMLMVGGLDLPPYEVGNDDE